MAAPKTDGMLRAPLMTVREVLKLPSMEGASVVAGVEGLGRNVTNAMVLEGPDVEKWGRPGLLLVTSFYALEPLTDEARQAFFDKLAGIGIAGIVFKPDRLLKDVPASYAHACDSHAIPIVRIRPDTTFESVLMDVMGNAIDSNVTLLNHFFEIHRQTMKLALEQPSIHTIVSRLKDSLGHDATYYSRTDEIRISTDSERGSFFSAKLRERERNRYQSFHYYDTLLDYGRGGVSTALAARIPGLDAQSSYLIIHQDPSAVTPVEYMTVENFVSLLQTEALKEAAIDQRIFNRNNMAVHDLLLNRLPSREALDRSLKELGIDAHSRYQAMLLRIVIDDPERQGQLQDLLSAFRRRLKKARLNTVFFQSNNRITFLCNFPSRLSGFSAEGVTTLLEELGRDDELPSFTYLAALSETTDRFSLSTINEQVMGIYKLFGSDRAASRVIRYEDLGIYKLFLGTQDHARIRGYVDPRLSRLFEENPEGFRTLVTLCEENLRYNAAAERLFVHPKTIHYRVRRIRESYGIDVRDSGDLMQVLVASTVLGLLGDASGTPSPRATLTQTGG